MTADLAADVRLLEDVHRLQRSGIDHADVVGDLGEARIVGEPLELVVEVVLGVTDLVDAQVLGLGQLAARPERVFLEETPDRRTAGEELTVGDPRLLVRREHRPLLGRLPRVDDVEGALA